MMAAAFAALGLPHRYVLADVAPADAAAPRWTALRADDVRWRERDHAPQGRRRAAWSTSISPDAPLADAVNSVVPRRRAAHRPQHGPAGDRGRAAAAAAERASGRAVLLGARRRGPGGRARALERRRRRSCRVARSRRLLGAPRRSCSRGRPGRQRHARRHRVDESPVPADLLRPDLAVLRPRLSAEPDAPRARGARRGGARDAAAAGCSWARRWRSLELWLGVPAPDRCDARRRCARRARGVASMPDASSLVGLSGSGKSTRRRAGRASGSAGRSSTSTRASSGGPGGTPATLIERDGEAALPRDRGAEARRGAWRVPGAVIATGGGAVIDPLNRWALWDAGHVVWLDAPDDRLAERLASLRRAAARSLARRRRARRSRACGRRGEPFYRGRRRPDRVDAAAPGRRWRPVIAAAARRHGRARAGCSTPRAARPSDGPRTARVVLGRDLDAATLAPTVDRHAVDGRARGRRRRTRGRGAPRAHGRAPRRSGSSVSAAASAASACAPWSGCWRTAAALRAERGDAWIAVGGGTTGDLGGHRRGALPPGCAARPGAHDLAGPGRLGASAARSPSTSPRPRTRRVPSGRRWRSSADVAALRTLPRARLLDGMAEVAQVRASSATRGCGRCVETRGEAALAPRRTPTRPPATRWSSARCASSWAWSSAIRSRRGERRTLNLGHTLGPRARDREPLPAAARPGGRARPARRGRHRRGPRRRAGPRASASTTSLRRLGYRAHAAPSTGRPSGTRWARDKKRVRGRQRWILPMAVGQRRSTSTT